MKEENKEFYKIGAENGLTEYQVDSIIEAYDEFCEDVIYEALRHMTAKEKLDSKKYRQSAKGKKAIAKYERKLSRAGYKVDKALSKKMKKVADFRNITDDIEEALSFVDPASISKEDIEIISGIKNVAEMTDEQSHSVSKILNLCSEASNNILSDDEILESLSIETLAEIDSMIDDIIAFNEACSDTASDIDSETGERLTEFKHMTASARLKQKKYRNSASGKKSLARYLKKSNRAGYRVNKQLSKKMSKVAKFALKDSVDESIIDDFDRDTLNFVFQANDFLKEMENEGYDIESLRESCIKEDEDEIVIMVPVSSDDEDTVTAAADECDVDIVDSKKDEDGEILFTVEGDYEELRKFLDMIDIQDSVNDLAVEDDIEDNDDIDEAFKKHSAAERAANRRAYKKLKNKAWFKKSKAKYARKASKAGYHIDKQRSRDMKKIAQARVEAVEQTLDSYLSASPLLGGLNEGQNNELMAVLHSTVMKLVSEASNGIEKDIRGVYEDYINEELVPGMTQTFDAYKDMMRESLYEEMNQYLSVVAQQVADEVMEKKFFVKSPKSECLENFTNKLVKMIEEDLKIYPQREDAVDAMQEKLNELNSELIEAKVSSVKLSMQLDEQKKDLYLKDNIPSFLSESEKDEVVNYANTVLASRPFLEFKVDIDNMINRLTESRNWNYGSNNKMINENHNSNRNNSAKFDFMELFNR